MEDAPKKRNEDEEILPRPDIDSQNRNEKYSSLWRRFNLRRLESLRSNNEEDDDDDEEDDAPRSTNKKDIAYDKESGDGWVYNRFLRIRKKIRPLMPTLEIVEYEDKNLVKATAGSNLEKADSPDNSAEVISADVLTSVHGHKEIISEQISQKQETDMIPSEPESLEQILKRRELNNEITHDNEPRFDGFLNKKNADVLQKVTTSTSVYPKPISTIDKYFDKKKQQKNIKKITEKEINATKINQDTLRTDLEAKILESEKQHSKLKESLEFEAIKAIGQIEKNEKGIKNNIKNEAKDKISTKAETRKPNISANEIDPRQKMIDESRQEIDRISQFQNTVKGVESLKETNITSEFAFERRHEVKDKPQSSLNTKFVPLTQTDLRVMEKNIQKLQNEQKITRRARALQTVKNLGESPDSLQAAQTGMIGALVGVAIFLIIYALS